MAGERKKYRCILFVILTVAWMTVIFLFSAQNADESSSTSGRIGRLIGHVLVSGFDDMSATEQAEFIEMVEYPVRKTAHATEYAILVVLIFNATGILSDKIRYIAAWGGAVVYAFTDEIHQLFVAGRSGQFTDVCIDALGALVAVVLCWIIGRRKHVQKL